MTREQLIQGIQTLNPTATRDFLTQFSDPQLAAYLHRLSEVMPTSAHLRAA